MDETWIPLRTDDSLGISYVPKEPNGAMVILKEPGEEGGTIEGNNVWFKKVIANEAEKEYSGRILDMLRCVGLLGIKDIGSEYLSEIEKIYFSNVLYGKNVGGSEKSDTYKSLTDEDKECRVKEILEFVENKKNVNLKYVFIDSDVFQALKHVRNWIINKNIEGIIYKNKKLEAYKDGDKFYFAIEHPSRSSIIEFEATYNNLKEII